MRACVCVCMCMRVCVCVCVYVCVCVCVRARARAYARAGMYMCGSAVTVVGADVCIPFSMLADVCHFCRLR